MFEGISMSEARTSEARSPQGGEEGKKGMTIPEIVAWGETLHLEQCFPLSFTALERRPRASRQTLQQACS
jgi:hypothetical protein